MGIFNRKPKADNRHAAHEFDEAINQAVATALSAHMRPDLMANALERRAEGLRMRSALSYSAGVAPAVNAAWAEKEKKRLGLP